MSALMFKLNCFFFHLNELLIFGNSFFSVPLTTTTAMEFPSWYSSGTRSTFHPRFLVFATSAFFFIYYYYWNEIYKPNVSTLSHFKVATLKWCIFFLCAQSTVNVIWKGVLYRLYKITCNLNVTPCKNGEQEERIWKQRHDKQKTC